MSSEGLVYELKGAKGLSARDMESSSSSLPRYTFYAEKNNGTFIYLENRPGLGPTFVCQRLHVFELHEGDLESGRWCSQCNQTPKRRRKSSFYVNYNGEKDMLDINCENGHAYRLNLGELKGFKSCPRCAVPKRGQQGEAEKAKMAEEDAAERQFKNYESSFIDSYKRLVEAFPLIRKLPTTSLVAIYFNNELYKLPEDHQPNCMAVHLILEQRAFLKAIFDKLDDQLRKKFFHKIVAGINPAFSLEPKTLDAYEYVYSLTH